MSEDKIAEEKYPYISKDMHDVGIREHNQRQYDKRCAFVEGFRCALSTQNQLITKIKTEQ